MRLLVTSYHNIKMGPTIFTLPLIFLLVLLHQLTTIKSDCTLSINNNLGETQPLLLKLNRSIDDPFYLPDENGNFTFIKGEAVNVTCTAGSVILDSLTLNQSNLVAACISGVQFEINKQYINISQLNCTQSATHFAKETGRKCPGSNYTELAVTLDVPPPFPPHIISCFDHGLKNVLYTWYNLTSHISGQSSLARETDFQESTFYNLTLDVNILYMKKTQARTINRLLGLSNTNPKYINQSSGNFYLARGHLTANRDFVYDAQQRSTFYFINAAPQWQCFNNGNWKTLEENLRSYASKQKLDLVVYTGTYGIATLPHEETGEETQLFLYVVDGKGAGIPVPKFFWKFVYDPKTKKGTVFIGTNNPYKSEKEMICEDISDSIKWLTWKKDDQVSGYSYACSVDDFRRTVSYLPKYEVKALLT